MHTILLALAALAAGGILSCLAGTSRNRARIGACSAVAGCAMAVLPAVTALSGRPVQMLRLAWDVPGGSFSVALDALSALFLAPILLLGILGAFYGHAYMERHGARTVRAHWFFYNLLIASMILVVIARNGVLFLVAWEIMALASFFLVTTDHEKESVRVAGWTYLVATHLGTAFLLGLFALLGRSAGSLDFDRFEALTGLAPAVASAAFMLAVIGFGAKAGFVPFHVWLPEAHPAAPSHVSALMSGVMIKTGIYGLVRTLTFLGGPPAWWGWTLILIGLASGVFGVVFALAQHDLKRLLAYHSVENIGIIALGLGVGVLGLSLGAPFVSAAGFAGALLHVLNHAVFKGLLFLCAGSVIHAAGTGEIDRLGGLMKRMPQTGLAFLVGAAAITGLPPLNGFVSEYLIFLASFEGVAAQRPALSVPLAGGMAGLALISGLAAACFTKAFGIVFLGEARSEHAARVADPPAWMRHPQAILAVLCVAIGLLAPLALRAVAPAVAAAMGDALPGSVLQTAGAGLRGVTTVCAAFAVLCMLLAAARFRLLARREVAAAQTWGCGYAAPTARMQYTASSYAQPLTALFHFMLRTHRNAPEVSGLFPEPSAFASHAPDLCREGFYVPLFRAIERGLNVLRRLQHGNLQLYVLYIALTLLALLVWKLW